jgi:hypothetical protein
MPYSLGSIRSERIPLGSVNHNVPRASKEDLCKAAKKARLAEQSRVRMERHRQRKKRKEKESVLVNPGVTRAVYVQEPDCTVKIS